jgi:hypothetical protein
MRKIRLDPESLSVDSFSPSDESLDPRGTVKAQGLASRTCPPTMTDDICCTLQCSVPCSPDCV